MYSMYTIQHRIEIIDCQILNGHTYTYTQHKKDQDLQFWRLFTKGRVERPLLWRQLPQIERWQSWRYPVRLRYKQLQGCRAPKSMSILGHDQTCPATPEIHQPNKIVYICHLRWKTKRYCTPTCFAEKTPCPTGRKFHWPTLPPNLQKMPHSWSPNQKVQNHLRHCVPPLAFRDNVNQVANVPKRLNLKVPMGSCQVLQLCLVDWPQTQTVLSHKFLEKFNCSWSSGFGFAAPPSQKWSGQTVQSNQQLARAAGHPIPLAA